MRHGYRSGNVCRCGRRAKCDCDAPLNAAEVSATVQVDPADGVSDVGLHEIPLKAGVWRMVTVPPLADVNIPAPVVSAEKPLVS